MPNEFKIIGENHKLQMNKALCDMGWKDWEKKARSKLKQKFRRVKIKTTTLRVCEVGSRLRNEDCRGHAYRRVHTRFGNKWTCDDCSMKIALENELNWEFYARV